MRGAVELRGIDLDDVGTESDGALALRSLLAWASEGLRRFDELVALDADNATRVVIGRVRGRGPGVAFGSVFQAVERAFPRQLESPFEGTDAVAGTAWVGDDLLDDPSGLGMLKLRFSPGTDDLPMHSHEHSDRFIVVLEGRGFYHASCQPVTGFDGRKYQTIAVRERDVLMFRRGTVHTFSTTGHPLVLMSVHRPFVALDATGQYTLPPVRCLPGREPPKSGRLIGCDWGWTAVV